MNHPSRKTARNNLAAEFGNAYYDHKLWEHGWVCHTTFHYQWELDGMVVDYWPSEEKWSHNGKVYHKRGDQGVMRFVANLKKEKKNEEG